MKISSLGSVKSGSGAKKKRAVAGTGSFADLLGLSGSSQATATDSANAVAATSPVASLLAAQEVAADDTPQAFIEDGNATLDVLDNLRHRLLLGTVPANLLGAIKSRISKQKQQARDPQLRAIMDEIELRASVELAKLEVALTNQQASRSGYPADDGI